MAGSSRPAKRLLGCLVVLVNVLRAGCGVFPPETPSRRRVTNGVLGGTGHRAVRWVAAAEDPSAGGTPGGVWHGFGSACLYLPHPLEELGAMCFSGGLGARRCQVGDSDHGDDRKDQR